MVEERGVQMIDSQWFTDSKYGLFIHFGLYSVAARHEWVQTLEEMDDKAYSRYFNHFNPDLFNAVEWAERAKKYGFKYVIFTVKHHDGFCLWDTKGTSFNITQTSFKRDLLDEFVEAFRAQGIKVGLYYSLLDWHQKSFPIDGYHPMRNHGKSEGDIQAYQQFMKEQIRELLTHYGRIDYLWFDFSYASREWKNYKGKGPKEWDSLGLEKLIYSLQPQILLNDRLGLSRGVKTPEQFSRSKGMGEDLWETVQTLNNSWGYDRDNKNFKTSEMVLKQLIDTVSKGGNFVINIGPNARGEWDQRSDTILKEVGEWFRLNGDSIYNARSSSYRPPVDCRYTAKGNKLYLHVFSWPYRTILLPDLGGKLEFARMLNDGSEIRFVDTTQIGGERKATENLYKEITEVHIKESLDKSTMVLNLPVEKPNDIVPVIELTLKKED